MIRTLEIRASAVTPANMVMEMAPMTAIVVAAFCGLGLRKAGTPLEIASTPVSAVHPWEKARSTSITRASPARFVSPGSAAMPYWADSATGASPTRYRKSPVAIMISTPPTKR